MSILLWIIFGALAGWIASSITGTNERFGAIANIVLGIVGALFGGIIFDIFGGSGVTGFNLYSLVVAILGATLAIMVIKSLTRHTSANL